MVPASSGHLMTRMIFAAAAFGLAAAVCAAASPAASAANRPDDFRPCPDASNALAGAECARFETPLDRAEPGLGSAELFVRRFPAAGASRGQAWLVAGGPGESGASFYPLLATFRAAFPGYDLIIPDHRGTGLSTRLCPAEEAPGSPGGTALQGAEWGACFPALAAPRAKAFTITNAARDLTALMDRYGANTPTYLYGVSYGTQLVLRTLAVSPPRRLDGVILDSLVPPETTHTFDLSRRSFVVDAVGRKVLAQCDADAACRARLGGDALGAYRAAIADPKAAALVPGAKPKLFFGALLDVPALRARIPDLVAALRAGDPGPLARAEADLEAFGAPFAAYPQSPSSIPLVSLISASENNARPALTRADVEAEAADLLFVSSLPGQLVGADAAYPRDAFFGKLPARFPPTLVLHGDLDPKTPYAGAVLQVRALDAAGPIALSTVTGGPHFLALTAPDCFVAAAKAFAATRKPVSRTCTLDDAGEGAGR
jgi:pimeloyl-ACP methyl ester carboxylesterase